MTPGNNESQTHSEQQSSHFLRISEQSGDRSIMMYNELVQFRFAMSCWEKTLTPIVDSWTEGSVHPKILEGMDHFTTFLKDFNDMREFVEKGGTDKAVNKYRGKTAKDAKFFLKKQQFTGEHPKPSDFEDLLSEEFILKHDIQNGINAIRLTLDEGTDFTPERKLQIQGFLENVKAMTSGEIYPQEFYAQQIQEIVTLQLGDLASVRGIKADLYTTLNETTRNLPLSWSYIHLSRLMNNVVQNAVREHIDNLQVTVGVDDTTNWFYITFDDNGPGYDAELLGDNPFKYRLSKHAHAKGEGIGMYGIQESIKKLNGSLRTELRKDDSGAVLGSRLIASVPIDHTIPPYSLADYK